MKKIIICSSLLLAASVSLFAQDATERLSSSYVASAMEIKTYSYHYIDLDNSKNSRHETKYLYEDVARAFLNHMKEEIGKLESGHRRGYDYNAIPTIILQTGNEVNEDYINKINIGREIVEFWFSKKPGQNEMNSDVVYDRGEYAASDQDVLMANSSQLGYAMVKEKGWKLIAQSYLEVITLTDLEETETKRTYKRTDYKTGNTYTETRIDKSYKATAKSQLFKLNFDEETRDQVFNAWENDEEFNRIRFKMTLERSETTSSTSDNSFSEAATKFSPGYVTTLKFISQDIDRKIAIFDVNPIRAKVGTKEGIGYRDCRYKVYKYKEDENGNAKAKAIGFTRLATIAKNEYKSQGNSEDFSTWVHIGGYDKVKPGMELKQKDGGNVGISPYYGIGGLSTEGLTVDYCFDWNLGKNPNVYGANYVIVDFGIHPTSFKKIAFYDLTVGYGYGLNLTRFLEIRPFAKIGMDILGGISKPVRSAYTHLVGEEYKQDSVVQFAVIGGADINLQLFYPVYLFGRVDYSAALGKSQLYKDIHMYDNSHGKGGIFNNGTGLGIKGGIRIVL